MYKVKEICEKIKSTSSLLEKEAILRENSVNEQFVSVLNFVFNPFILSGISTKKINKEVTLDSDRNFGSFQELLDYLDTNNTGTNQVIANVKNYITSQDSDIRDFLSSIVTKSIKLGCDVKTLNKVFGKGFIPQWEVQQSYSLEKYKLTDGEWFSLSEKINGIRGTYFKGNIISRQGKEISGLEHIISDINMLGQDNYVYDGELKRKNIDGLSDNENFRIGTGIINNDDNEKTCIEFIIYDMLPVDEFENGESKLTYKERRIMLREIEDKIKGLNLENISTVDILYSGCDTGKIQELLSVMVESDKEGLMLNRDMTYKCKRHNGILKVKKFHTVDLEILDLEEGTGRLKGKLGAFIVDYKGNALNVGTGITDDLRERFWNEKESLVGRIIEVKYKEESYDKKTSLKSLQFPVYVTLREEGKNVSYN